MPLSARDRSQVVDTAVDVLRHRKRKRLIGILGERVERGEYADEHERRLDRVAWSIARAIDEQLSEVPA